MANHLSSSGYEQRGVLFDLDGVLLDTETTYSEIWTAIEQRFPTGVQDFCHVIKGRNLHEILTNYFATDDIRRQVTALLNDYQQHMRYELFAGAMDVVLGLERMGVPAAVVTSSDRHKMEAVYAQLPDFRSHFAAMVTGEMVVRAKPNPECFLLGARLLRRDITHCVVVEDSLNGLFAARASGARVAGIATTLPKPLQRAAVA